MFMHYFFEYFMLPFICLLLWYVYTVVYLMICHKFSKSVHFHFAFSCFQIIYSLQSVLVLLTSCQFKPSAEDNNEYVMIIVSLFISGIHMGFFFERITSFSTSYIGWDIPYLLFLNHRLFSYLNILSVIFT